MSGNQEYKYFYEDEVYRITKKGTLQFGMVVENAEFASSDESEDEEESPLKAGQVRVSWYPAGREEVVSDKKVHLADRSLMPGDVVRRLLKGKKTQMGYCRDVKVLSSLQIMGTQQVIFGVKSEQIVPLETFKSDILICLDGWVGMVREVKAKLTLRFNDGSKVVIGDDVAEELEDIKDKRDADCEFKRYDFYPGQVLFGAVKNVEAGEWSDCSQDVLVARKHKPYKAFKMTVEDINFISLGVNWMCRAYFSSNTATEEARPQPNFRVDTEKLSEVKMLNVFEPCTLQIGDRNFYTLTENDIMMLKPDWKRLLKDQLLQSSKKKNSTPKLAVPEEIEDEDNSTDYEDIDNDSDCASVSSHDSTQNIEDKAEKRKKKSNPGLMTKVLKKKKLKKSKKNAGVTSVLSFNAGDKVVTETLSTRSEVEVVWQDGTVEAGVPSSELFPVQHLDDHEFFPGDFVTEAKEGFQPHSYGVVQEVDHSARCCRIKWFRTYTEGAQPQPIYVSTTEASVYDLKDHPDFKFRPGSIVIRVSNTAGDDCGLGAGQVLDNSPSGQVSVWWAGQGDGVRSSCWPQDLYRVGEYDSDEGDLWYDSDDEEGSEDGNESWETEDEEERVGDEKIEDAMTEEDEIKNKLAEKIERARVTMTRLEEILKQNPSLQTPNVTKQLLEVYRDCRHLDRLMGTEYFHEKEFSGLLDKVKDHDRISSVDAAVKDQLSRLFSSDESPGKDSGNGSFAEASSESVEDDQKADDSVIVSSSGDTSSHVMCVQLCSLIKDQLLKAHAEVVKRFGNFSSEDKTKVNSIEVNFDDIDLSELDQLVARGLAALNFVPIETEFKTPKKEEPSSAGEDVPPTPEADTSLLDRSISLSTPLSPGSFVMAESVPETHKFKLTIFNPTNMKNFLKHVRKELKLLEASLPAGIVVRGYEDRIDLFSAMIHGPKNTPYEDGLFFFDFQLGPDYPAVPPQCHYVAFCTDKLNPNLYEEGKVCVSLLGTWSGKGTETWTSDSNLLQLLVSIQGLILVPEPYYNEAGYERQKGTQIGEENSRMYNEMAVLKLVQSMTRMVINPAQPFNQEILDHMRANGQKFVTRLRLWRQMSMEQSSAPVTPTSCPSAGGSLTNDLPDFPLIPASKGFCLTLDKTLKHFEECLSEAGVVLK